TVHDPDRARTLLRPTRERRREMRSKAILSVVIVCLAVAVVSALVGVGCRAVTGLDPSTGRPLDVSDAGPADAYVSPRRDGMPGDVEPPDAPLPPDAPTIDGGGIDEAACNSCEASMCRNVDGLDLYAACFLATDTAMSGPGAGKPKSDLCKAVL